jgi:hypothetical protein
MMPKVLTITARKDYPDIGVKKGDTYYKWRIRTQRGGQEFKSKTYPRASQLTNSEYKSAAHQINEGLEDTLHGAEAMEDLREARDEAVSAAESLRDEQQEKLDNMPEQLQSSETGELLQNRIDALEAFIEELNNLDLDDFEAPEESEQDEGQTEDEFVQSKLDEIGAISIDVE